VSPHSIKITSSCLRKTIDPRRGLTVQSQAIVIRTYQVNLHASVGKQGWVNINNHMHIKDYFRTIVCLAHQLPPYQITITR